jgi:nitrate/TMAO reductase-like tetraheme cytochrome c subunit
MHLNNAQWTHALHLRLAPIHRGGEMAATENDPSGQRRGLWRRLTSPSATWSVLGLLVIGLVIGAGGVIGTQVMVAATGTNEFCGGACHSMQWVANEYKQSVHFVNRTGVRAECHDCHIPHDYPRLLWYKARAGIKDVIGEMSGVISTEEKFKAERKHMAEEVWAEFKETNSENCQHCHAFDAGILAKQKDFVRPMHEQVLAKAATCIDCHKGVAHASPE